MNKIKPPFCPVIFTCTFLTGWGRMKRIYCCQSLKLSQPSPECSWPLPREKCRERGSQDCLSKREAANAIFSKKVLCKKVPEERSVRVTLTGFHRVLVPLGHLIILLPSKNFLTGLVRLFTIWSLLVSTSSSIFQTYHLLFLLFKHTNLSTQRLLTVMFLWSFKE